MQFDAAIFDLDGTLLDTLEDLGDAMNAALAAQGFPAHPYDAYRYFVGNGLRKMALRALPAEVQEDDAIVEACMAHFREVYGAGWQRKTRPYAGVPALLDGLTLRGLPLGVLSNKPHEFTVQCVAALLPDWRFAAVQGVADGVPPKPDTTGARVMAERLGVPPERILYLGDTATDMETARGAGMYPVGALWGFRTAEELEAAGAARLCARPEDVLET